MTIIEERALTAVCYKLPEIARQLEKISESLAIIASVALGDNEFADAVKSITKKEGEAK